MKTVVQLPYIFRSGRFCNQLIRYVAGRHLAVEQHLQFETDTWMGEIMFDLHDSRIKDHPKEECWVLPAFFEMPSDDVLLAMTRPIVKSLLVWKREFLRQEIPKCKAAVHIREDDFLWRGGWPMLSAEEAVKQVVGCGFHKSEIEVVQESKPHNSGLFPSGLEFLEDFQILMKAENTFAYPRSTFSWMAGLLGTGNLYMPANFKNRPTSCTYVLSVPANPQ